MVTWWFFVLRFSNIDVHQNQLGDLLNRIAESHFQNFWFNSSEVRSTNLLFWQVPGWCCCCWSGSRLGEPLPLHWRQWGRRPSWFPVAPQNLLLSNSEFPHCVRCAGSALPGCAHCFDLFFMCIVERLGQIPRPTESEFRISVVGD